MMRICVKCIGRRWGRGFVFYVQPSHRRICPRRKVHVQLQSDHQAMTHDKLATGPVQPADGNTAEAAAPVSVLHQVYGAFADAFAGLDGCKDAAERMRKTLIQDGGRSEAALRAALFGTDGA
jgi:hypothetical protein